MKQINKYIWGHLKNPNFSIVERLHINKDTGNHDHHYNYHPTTIYELEELVNKLIKERGNEADLNDIDTSKITNMFQLFFKSKFNGDISNWDVSNVESMNGVFEFSEFTGENGDISNWDVRNVKDMSYMFMKSNFNGNISEWDVSNVKEMRYMFNDSKFTGDISEWDVSKVKNMWYMFLGSPLEKNPPKWYK